MMNPNVSQGMGLSAFVVTFWKLSFPWTLASMTFHQVTKYIKEQHERNKAVITSIIKIDIALTKRSQTTLLFHMEMKTKCCLH